MDSLTVFIKDLVECCEPGGGKGASACGGCIYSDPKELLGQLLDKDFLLDFFYVHEDPDFSGFAKGENSGLNISLKAHPDDDSPFDMDVFAIEHEDNEKLWAENFFSSVSSETFKFKYPRDCGAGVNSFDDKWSEYQNSDANLKHFVVVINIENELAIVAIHSSSNLNNSLSKGSKSSLRILPQDSLDIQEFQELEDIKSEADPCESYFAAELNYYLVRGADEILSHSNALKRSKLKRVHGDSSRNST